MARHPRTVEEMREEARSLRCSAAADPDPERSARYAAASGRLERCARLVERGMSVEEATRRVLGLAAPVGVGR